MLYCGDGDFRVVTPLEFRKWRKELDLSQKEAANVLGLKRRVVQYYEKGERDGEKVKIPVTVQLACWAVYHGHRGEWDGPQEGDTPVIDCRKTRLKKKTKEKPETKTSTKNVDGSNALKRRAASNGKLQKSVVHGSDSEPELAENQ